jgi:hypothetical protein
MNVHLQLQSSGDGTSGGKLSFQERIKVMTNYVKASGPSARGPWYEKVPELFT